jgi:phosphoribosylamine-glycine ligase
MILRMLKNPAEIVLQTARNEKLKLEFNDALNFGCSLTLAGYGYPFTQVRGPHLPLEVDGQIRLRRVVERGRARRGRPLTATGQRIADVIALAPELDAAIAKAYANIRKIRVVGSYFRTDVGPEPLAAGNGVTEIVESCTEIGRAHGAGFRCHDVNDSIVSQFGNPSHDAIIWCLAFRGS